MTQRRHGERKILAYSLQKARRTALKRRGGGSAAAMIPMDFGVETALNSGTPAPVTTGAPAAASSRTAGWGGRTAACESASFHDELQAATCAGARSRDHTGASDRKAPVKDGAAVRQPAANDAASACRSQNGDARSAEDIASLLLQLLQKVEPAAPAFTSASDTPAVSEEGAMSDDRSTVLIARVLEILKQLTSSPNGVASPENPDVARLAEHLGQLNELSSDARPEALAGKIHQLLADLREHLAGAALGKAVKETITDGLPAAQDPEERGPSPNDAEPAGMAPGTTRHLPDAAASAVPDPAPAPVFPGREVKSSPTQSRIASAVEPSMGVDKPVNAEAESPATSPASAGSTPAATRAEGLRGTKLPETQRPSMPAADTTAPSVGFGEDQNADMSGSRSSTGDRSFRKDVAGGDVATPPKASGDDSLEAAAPLDPRLTRLHETGLERPAEVVAAGKEKEPAAAGSARTGLFDQIVQRAVVQVRNDQSEIKIDLKPDFLGNVRMQILTENQQVSVRILTEHPAVRDMLEAGLQQLKSELQNQGLHVDRLEVSVSDDQRQHSRRQAKPEGSLRPGVVEGISAADRRAAEERLEPVYYRPRRGGGIASIDMFA